MTDTFALLAEEVESSGQGVLVAFMGNMASKEYSVGVLYFSDSHNDIFNIEDRKSVV